MKSPELRHFGCLLPLLLAAGLACAQQAASAPTNTDLAKRQEAVRQRVQRLEDRLLVLGRILAETEPEKAERLNAALAQFGERRLKHRLESAEKLIADGRFGDAEREQAALLADMREVLKLLTDTASQLDRLRDERKRLEATRRAVRELQDRQLEQLQRTQAARLAAPLAQELRDRAQQLEALADRQQRLQAAKERDVAEQQRLAEETKAAAKALQQQANEQEDAESREGLNAAANEAQQSAERMKSAAEQAEHSQENQQAAEEHLRAAIRRLREEADRLDPDGAIKRLAEPQQKLADQAGELQKQIQSESQEQSPTPGGRQLEAAEGHMQKAAQRLEEQAPGESEVQQQAALEQLQRARDELEDALRQVRREELVETLTAVGARIASLLSRERKVREAAGELDKLGAENWKRTEELALAESARIQHSVVEDGEQLVRILEGEGTTVILPDMAEQIVADMAAIATRLDESDPGRLTQTLLDSVIAELEQISAAVETQRKEQQDELMRDAQGGQSGDQSQPLLPPSAELKLLRAQQVRINERTTAVADENAALPPAQRTAELERLGARQRRLTELTRRMHESQP